MIIRGSRIDGVPYIVEDDKKSPLKRISFTQKEFQEDWIQNFIHKHPDIIPISEIEPIFSPLISIGKEVSTEAGYIDNLYISPNGYLTIVETKLWRNSEARREVVGQIIDYAKNLNKWTFSDLNESVKIYNQKYNNNSNGIIETIKNQNSEFDIENSHKLIDRINRNLKQGKFLLLILGDGIRENVEEMVDYLSKTPQLNFTLALIELQVYKFTEKQDNLLVIPQIVTRTKEITRATVQLEGSFTGNINISVPEEKDEQKTPSKRFTITADNFFEELKLNTNIETVNFVKFVIKDCENRGYKIEWLQSSFRVILQMENKFKISLFIIYKSGDFYLGWSGIYFISKEMKVNFAKKTSIIISDATFSDYKENWEKLVKIDSLIENYDDFINEVDNFSEKIKEEFKKTKL